MFNLKRSKVFSLLSDTKGSVVVLVAVVLFLLVAILMMTVDLGRVQSGKTNNQAAIDASVLGAAEYVTRYRVRPGNDPMSAPTDMKEYAKKILMQNLAADQADATISQTTDEYGNVVDNFQIAVGGSVTGEGGQVFTASASEVVVYACLDVKTGFAAALGNGESKKVCNYAKASLPSLNNVEIVFALDVSTSMLDNCASCGTSMTKLEALRQSVSNVMDAYGTNTGVYWGMVPYNGMVDLGKMAGTPGAPNIVANDIGDGSPSDEILPKNFNFKKEGTSTWNYAYKFDGIEDQVVYPNSNGTDYGQASQQPNPQFGNYFDDVKSWGFGSKYSPPEYAQLSLDAIRRIPLTAREGNTTPENAATINFDDARPGLCPSGASDCTSGSMFLAYWHHPYDFYIEYVNNNPSQPCGECINWEPSVQKHFVTSTGQPLTQQCHNVYYEPCHDPSGDHTGCTTGSGNTGLNE